MKNERWDRLAEHFDTALSLPGEAREQFVARVTADDPELRRELMSLLAASDAATSFLEVPAQLPSVEASPEESLTAGYKLGAWRIERLIGRGGMGEVYEVQRADGQFEQRAALKVTRHEAARVLERFNAERQILARLDHPGIARLLDGGVMPDGRPYAVMEYVEGQPITAYCDASQAGFNERIALFQQVCDAVEHAHNHLIVHRDIKPANVLVDRDGRVRLLDFGIAKPLDAGLVASGTGELTALMLTPDYAAPEQLTGEPVTTATDVYALGILLYELLVGTKPRSLEGRSLASILTSVLDESVPLPSEAASRAPNPRVPARMLKGDLDAIVGKCLRPEARQRYASVSAIRVDIERMLRGEPVLARGDAGWYVLGRLLRRYRWAAASLTAVVAALSVGIALSMWQAERATREARRAEAARDFLVSVFRESDPKIARDRPPGAITAKELLDQSVDRIEVEFADDPATQLHLLGVITEIYGLWLDGERFVALLEKRKQIAREHFGETHPSFIEVVILDAWGSIYGQDYAEGQRLLRQADELIRAGGHEGSLLRAQWWLAQAETYKGSDPSARSHALDEAIRLYRRLAPTDEELAIALVNSAVVRFAREDYAGARDRSEEAIEVFLEAEERSDADLAITYSNLARSLQHLGDYDAAEDAYRKFAELMRSTHSQEHGSYWLGAADHARFVHMRGERERANRMFEELMGLIRPDWTATTEDVIAREYYAERLAAEGRAAEAIPLLEAAEKTYIERPLRDHDLRRVRQTLGDAYDQVGRHEDARRALSEARAERMQKDPPDSAALLGARERWARFLLDRGDLAAASAELDSIFLAAKDKPIAPIALAHADRSRIAMLQDDSRTALDESTRALEVLERMVGLYDVRIEPLIWRTHAAILARNGDAAGAATWNAKALEASRRYDHPSSATVALATSHPN